jgi:hypothetical protein
MCCNEERYLYAEGRIMWNESKRQRFRALCARERQGILTAEEKTELEGLYHAIEEMEATYLRPATKSKQQEREKLHALNEALRDVIRRKEAHLARMKAALAQWRVEREALDTELERLLAQATAEVGG